MVTTPKTSSLVVERHRLVLDLNVPVSAAHKQLNSGLSMVGYTLLCALSSHKSARLVDVTKLASSHASHPHLNVGCVRWRAALPYSTALLVVPANLTLVELPDSFGRLLHRRKD